jgi:hypothetical protein
MANGVNRRNGNGNGNGEWEGEWTPDGGWWDGTTTDPNTVPDPIVPVETPGTSVPFEVPELPTPVEPPAWLPMQGGAPPGLTATPGTSVPLEVPGIPTPVAPPALPRHLPGLTETTMTSVPGEAPGIPISAQPPALPPFPQAPPGLTQTTGGFTPAPQEFLEEGEFPIEEEAADPQAQITAQMKTPGYAERMAEQQRNRNYIGGWRGGLGRGGRPLEGPQYLNNPNWTWEDDVSGGIMGGEREEGGVGGEWILEKSQNLEAPSGTQVQRHSYPEGYVDPNVALDPSTSAWAQQTPTDPRFQEWLGRGAPTGREWGAGTEESLGNLNWNPESGKWEDLQYQPWQYSGGREGPSPWVGRPQVGDIADEVGDYPTAGGEDFPLRDLGALAGGTGIYAPGEELGPVAGAEHRGDIRRLWDEYQESIFGGGGIVGYPGQAENLSAFEQDYNRRVAEMQGGQAAERQKYADIVAQGGTPVVDPETGFVQPWTPPITPPPVTPPPVTPPPVTPPPVTPPPVTPPPVTPPPVTPPVTPPPNTPPVTPPPDLPPAKTATGGQFTAPSAGDQTYTTDQINALLDRLFSYAEEKGDQGIAPFQPIDWEAQTTIPIGTGPLDQLADVNLATLMQTGGVAPTPLAGETEATLRDILRERGSAAAAPVGVGTDVERELKELLSRGGAMPEDQRLQAMELEAARSPLDRLRRAQLAQGSAAMAQRGTLGMGTETDFRERLEGRLAPAYAQAGQELELAQRDRENQRYQQAIQTGQAMSMQQAALQEQSIGNAMQMATGMSQEQSRNLLNTVSTLAERQQMQNDIAIRTLDQNRQWNEFLADFGLRRDEVIDKIQRGRFQDIMPLIQAYMNSVVAASGGYIE